MIRRGADGVFSTVQDRRVGSCMTPQVEVYGLERVLPLKFPENCGARTSAYRDFILKDGSHATKRCTWIVAADGLITGILPTD